MQAVRFSHVDDSVRTLRFIPAETVVAWFRTATSTAGVRLCDLSAFRDVSMGSIDRASRPILVSALCKYVTQAPLTAGGTLDLAARFHVEPDHDDPMWRVTGFPWIETLDLKILKHVLGFGENEPQSARAMWRHLLEIDFDHEEIATRLAGFGCEVRDTTRLQGEDRLAIHAGLSSAARVACIELLSELREAYMLVTRDAVASVAQGPDSRHLHYIEDGRHGMDFLDDRGLFVPVGGPETGYLSVRTCYDRLRGGECALGPATLEAAWARSAQMLASYTDFRVHTLDRWGV